MIAGHAEHSNGPVMLTEFGGIAYHPDSTRTWGYSRCETADDLLSRYVAVLTAVTGVRLFAGFCYTQFADTYQEANGLLAMDRVPKIPLRSIYHATRGEFASDPGAVPGVDGGSSATPLAGALHGGV